MKNKKTENDLNILVKSDSICWLRNGKIKLMGYTRVQGISIVA